jgi:hypothetical protein
MSNNSNAFYAIYLRCSYGLSFSSEFVDKIVWKREKRGDKRIGERNSMEGNLNPKF